MCAKKPIIGGRNGMLPKPCKRQLCKESQRESKRNDEKCNYVPHQRRKIKQRSIGHNLQYWRSKPSSALWDSSVSSVQPGGVDPLWPAWPHDAHKTEMCKIMQNLQTTLIRNDSNILKLCKPKRTVRVTWNPRVKLRKQSNIVQQMLFKTVVNVRFMVLLALCQVYVYCLAIDHLSSGKLESDAQPGLHS